MGGIIRELGGIAILINGTADHVHILAVFPASASLSDTMRVLKTNSSRWVHENFPDHCAFSVSHSNLDAVRHYIATQEEHHRKLTFQEEFLSFLQKHAVEYDDRYIWE